MEKERVRNKKTRIPEIDFLRGAALLLMVWHHVMYDVRYIFHVNAFAFQDSYWFYVIGRSVVIALFLIVSGISTRFSANNLMRGRRMVIFSAFATVLTTVLYLIDSQMGIIFFNVIHVIALSTLFYAVIEHLLIVRHRKSTNGSVDMEKQRAKFIGFLITFGTLVVVIGHVILPILPDETRNPLFIILGSSVTGVSSLDQMPFLPHFGYYLLGAAIGQTLYESGEPLWKSEKGWFFSFGRPIRFMGRNALLVYVLHQPIILAILWALSKIGLI
ncbi:MAG TPA: DUF1624 domain-containing protein [Clostridiaceae bacterium]|nr:DUF1624 domain-containing protein [Clostridiaceae bacterium]